MKFLKTIFIGLIASTSFSQTPCTSGMAGIFPCNNVDLQSNLIFTQIGGTTSTQGNDCWGWTDPLTNKEYAIMCCTTHTAFVDITNPVAPVYLGKVNSHNNVSSIWRDVKVYNNHAFIVSEATGHGMQVFDLKRLRGVTTPQTFAPDARYAGFGNCHNIAINEATGFAYCIGSNTYSGGPHVVNIQNPLNPTLSFGYSAQGYCHDSQIVIYDGPDTEHAGKEIFFGANASKVAIVDVTNKSNPILLSTFTYQNTGYTHQGWLTPNKKYWILGDETDETSFGFNTKSVIIDLTDLDNPVLKGNYFGTTPAIDHNGYTLGNHFYLANYRAGMRIMDISSIDASNTMTEVGFFDSYPSSNTANYNGAWSVYPYFASGNIIISDIERGLFVVKKSGTLSTQNFDKNQFSLFPNPGNNYIEISAEKEIKQIEIIDVLGKTIASISNILAPNYRMDISSLKKGIYFIKLDNTTKKLIIE